MRPIPIKLRNEMASDPYYSRCARFGADCSGRITWEHAILYAGRQIQEKFAIIPLCVFHHLGRGLVKKINVDIAMKRATPENRKKYPLLYWHRYDMIVIWSTASNAGLRNDWRNLELTEDLLTGLIIDVNLVTTSKREIHIGRIIDSIQNDIERDPESG